MDESLKRATPPNKKRPIVYQMLTANRSLVVVSPSGVSSLAPEQLSAEMVGIKALGLCSMPDQWVPPFFVTTADSIAGSLTGHELTSYIELALSTCGISTSKVIIRSSGVAETILDRGRLESTPCGRNEILRPCGNC